MLNKMITSQQIWTRANSESNDQVEKTAERLAKRNERTRQGKLEETAEERETRLVFALNLLLVLIQQLRKHVEQFL